MKEFIDGNEAISRAAIQAGCNFFAGYPITPATSILLHMTKELPKVGGIAIQGEDEIASIGFCIGAAAVGKRVMTATSGPGISLYSENIGAAIMLEIPIVIVNVQRMGPATGAPTLGAYGDIQFVRWGNSGGYPIIALAPTNVIDCYHHTLRAFELAEHFRVPVFLLTDKETGLTKATVDSSEFTRNNNKEIQPPLISDGKSTENTLNTKGSPLHPRIGGPDLIRMTTSSHTRDGYLTKDPISILSHNQHLTAKIMDHLGEISMVDHDPQDKSDVLIISYGITVQAVTTAVQKARDEGIPISSLVVHSLWPVPEIEIRNALKKVKKVIIPELNLGLYRREIERLANDHHQIIALNRQDGGLISPKEIFALIRT
jgi:2-oxoglutarate ferredoxin oxidoreductase subunit alpha